MRFISGTRLDDRVIRTDWDAGFREGRQYGRGKSGGQVKTGSWEGTVPRGPHFTKGSSGDHSELWGWIPEALKLIPFASRDPIAFGG